MKKTKKYLLAPLFLLPVEIAYARGGDLVSPATNKVNEVIAMMSGDFAIAFTTVIIAGIGYGVTQGWVKKETAYKVGGGVALIGGAAQIANWIFGN